MSTTYAAPKKQGNGGGGEQWTPEQKAAYQQVESAFARYMRSLQKGDTRDFDAVVMAISEPYQEENTYPGVPKGTMRTVRSIKVELRGNAPVRLEDGSVASPDGMRFLTTSADNPFNDKTRLNALLRATIGAPDEDRPFTVDYDEQVVGQPVRVSIQKQGPRNDGKRGGFYSELKGFKRRIVDDLEVVTGPPQNTLASAGFTATPPVQPKSESKNASPIEESGIEDLPWAE